MNKDLTPQENIAISLDKIADSMQDICNKIDCIIQALNYLQDGKEKRSDPLDY